MLTIFIAPKSYYVAHVNYQMKRYPEMGCPRIFPTPTSERFCLNLNERVGEVCYEKNLF